MPQQQQYTGQGASYGVIIINTKKKARQDQPRCLSFYRCFIGLKKSTLFKVAGMQEAIKYYGR